MPGPLKEKVCQHHPLLTFINVLVPNQMKVQGVLISQGIQAPHRIAPQIVHSHIISPQLQISVGTKCSKCAYLS